MKIDNSLLIHSAELYKYLGQGESWEDDDVYSKPAILHRVRLEPTNTRISKENDKFEVADLLMFINDDVVEIQDKIVWNQKKYIVVKIDTLFTTGFNHCEVILSEIK